MIVYHIPLIPCVKCPLFPGEALSHFLFRSLSRPPHLSCIFYSTAFLSLYYCSLNLANPKKVILYGANRDKSKKLRKQHSNNRKEQSPNSFLDALLRLWPNSRSQEPRAHAGLLPPRVTFAVLRCSPHSTGHCGLTFDPLWFHMLLPQRRKEVLFW